MTDKEAIERAAAILEQAEKCSPEQAHAFVAIAGGWMALAHRIKDNQRP